MLALSEVKYDDGILVLKDLIFSFFLDINEFSSTEFSVEFSVNKQ
jgi:hypothetical protein